MTNKIRRIVIVGGGTAGWMAAASFAKFLQHSDYTIELIESDEIGTIGVGEATIPPIVSFNRTLQIDENEFIRATQATFKLGIEFVDWFRPGHRYFHPFGQYGVEMQGIGFHHFWLRHIASGGQRSHDSFNSCAMAALHGRFARPQPAERSPLPPINYAYHFDAGLYGKFLRRFAERLGARRLEGRIVQVKQSGENGNIESVVLADGREVAGDFFIDCSGFRGLLIEQALHAGYEDWSRWLPCDRAVAVPCDRSEATTPFTRSTATEAGWQWRIPLQHRTGNGYVYCSAYLNDDEAARLLLSRLDGAARADPRPLRFTTGRRREVWKNNCVALGLASGFIEPLESTSIHLVQSGIARLLFMFPADSDIDPATIAKYNEMCRLEMEEIRDFLLLHYKATERDDTPFWRHCRSMELTDSLRERWEMYQRTANIVVALEDLFKESSWFAVFAGQGVEPTGYHPFANIVSDEELQRRLDLISADVMKRVSTLPPHDEYIRQHCAAPGVG
ncbi:MAG TPA: tryptophan halogenase family protein [Steroidobacteraceae bacterium]|nr:tryptophan halogenase family protein [Steroidobacteraceae bacterium]